MVLRGILMVCVYLCTCVFESETLHCYRPDGTAKQCVPNFQNIAYGKNILSTNTCGSPPLRYCVRANLYTDEKACKLCNASEPEYSHHTGYLTDAVYFLRPTWWQSQTLNEKKSPVRLTMDLHKTYDVVFITITFHSSRPKSMAIYKKSTYDKNEQWRPFQFYSNSCQKTYGIPKNQILTISNQQAALCSEDESRITPLSGGRISFSTLSNRPGAYRIHSYPDLQEFMTVSSLRFDLDQLNTLGDEVSNDPKVLKSYFFAISNIEVGGRCKCNGHASECVTRSRKLECKCQHNTEGTDCEKCQPLYNDKPWKAGTRSSANACKKCECNGLADACVFDDRLWKESNGSSGGRCINCKNNTAGVHCERCKENYYRVNSGDDCKPCNCDSVGSVSLQCNNLGRCICNPGVTGQKCDQK